MKSPNIEKTEPFFRASWDEWQEWPTVKHYYYAGRGARSKNATALPFTTFAKLAEHLEQNRYQVPFTRDEWAAMSAAERRDFKENDRGLPWLIAGVPQSPAEGNTRGLKVCTHSANLLILDCDQEEPAMRLREQLMHRRFVHSFICYETPSGGLRVLIYTHQFPAEKYQSGVCFTILRELKMRLQDFDPVSKTINQKMFYPVRFKDEEGL